jgi:hypothetical protein
MPSRPGQHQIGSRAATAVTAVWESTGAAVERITEDYGEDLLVQTCDKNGRMDAARIWVQVKGTKANAKMRQPARKVTVPVRNDLALRWARTADVVVLVYWDVEAATGWYAIPETQVDLVRLADTPDATTRITVLSNDRFDTASARHLALRARLEHATKIVQRCKGMIYLGYDTDDVKAEMITTLIQVMHDVGIADNNRVTPAFLKTLYRLWKFYEGEAGRDLSPAQMLERAALGAVLTMVADAAEQAQPQAGIEFQELLIGELVAVTMTVLRPKEGWPFRPAWEEEDPAQSR